jgi:opacity protein-like surface antigen
MKTKMVFGVLICLAGFGFQDVFGQELNKDSLWKHTKKNTIRYNVSSPLIYGFDKSLIFGYERLLSPRRSFSINAGTVALPKVTNIGTDSISFNKDVKNSGYNISLDYRFYLAKENKFTAPRGVYIGPWYSYNRFKRDNTWDLLKADGGNKNVTTNANMDIHSFGVELGYQFVFWDRLAVDLVMIGPGMGLYKVNAKFDSNLTTEEREQLQQLLTDALENKFPGMNFVLDNKELDANGTLNVTSLGFRYLIHIGFRF